MFRYIFDHVIVNDPFLLLEAVHEAFLTDAVDHPSGADAWHHPGRSGLPDPADRGIPGRTTSASV